jgi:hypothetical protein
MIKMRLSLLLAMVSLLSAAHAAAPLPRVELPIKEVDLSDGMRRYAVQIMIDGTPLEAGLDTGSTGLRVLAPRLPATHAGGPYAEYHYGSGLGIKGKIAHLDVRFGADAGNLPVHLIDRLDCTALHPDCAAKHLAMADFGIQGDGLRGEGFPAILGTNMAEGDAPNPFTALGATRWIIELPQPGSSVPGRLILDPTDDEVAGFTPLKLIPALSGRKSGVHDALAGCLVRRDTNAKLCAPIMFDSGAPGLRISLEGFKAPWPNGTPAELALGDGHKSIGLAFTVGRRDQASGMFVEPLAQGAVPHISAGLMPYFGWSVLYDPENQTIGLKPRQ